MSQVAAQIVDQAVADLLRCVRAVCLRLGFVDAAIPITAAATSDSEAKTEAAPFDLVLAGSIAQSPLVSERLTAGAQRLAPHVRVVHQQVSPEMGAALLAWQQGQQA